eukprot:ANDGO_06691.mRNA.1 Eukaryotic translation initiation factor 3 subunit L
MKISDDVWEFLNNFFVAFHSRNEPLISKCYDDFFGRFSDRYFSSSRWPTVDLVTSILATNGADVDSPFFTFYEELYFRHVYMRLAERESSQNASATAASANAGNNGGSSNNTNSREMLSVEDRLHAFDCMINILQEVSRPDFALPLPASWLWDLFAEFVYQFQTWHWFRSRAEARTDDEAQILAENTQVFDVHVVVDALEDVVLVAADGNVPPSDKRLIAAQFARIGLLTVYTLVADYYSGIKAVEGLELRLDVNRHPQSHVALHYYLSVCLIMSKKFADATRTLNTILRERTLNALIREYQQGQSQGTTSRRNQHSRSAYSTEYIVKTCDRMFGLLALCQTVYSHKIDNETVGVALRERHGETISKMQRGDVARIEEEFQKAAPKFINPVPVSYEKETRENVQSEAMRRQVQILAAEVKAQINFANIRSFLRLYSSISVAKLARFLELSESELIKTLMSMKHKMRNTTHLEVDFFIDEGMVHIIEAKSVRQYGSHFVRQILKFAHAGNVSGPSKK